MLRSNQFPRMIGHVVVEAGGERARVDERDVDAERRQLIAEHAPHRLQRVLGHRIRPRSDTGSNAGDRRHDQDPAGAPALPRRRDTLGDGEGAEDVDLEHGAQPRHGKDGEGAGLAAAGIGNEHVEVPLIDRGHVVRIRDVELGDLQLRVGG